MVTRQRPSGEPTPGAPGQGLPWKEPGQREVAVGQGCRRGLGGWRDGGALLQKARACAMWANKCGGMQRLPRRAEGHGDVMGELGSGSSV